MGPEDEYGALMADQFIFDRLNRKHQRVPATVLDALEDSPAARVAARHREADLQGEWLQWVVQPYDVIKKHHRAFVDGPLDDATDAIIKDLAPDLVKAVVEQEVDEDVDEFLEGAQEGRFEALSGQFPDPEPNTSDDYKSGYDWGYASARAWDGRELPSGIKRYVVQEQLREFRGEITEQVVIAAMEKAWSTVSPREIFATVMRAVKQHGWKIGLVYGVGEIIENFLIPAAVSSLTGVPIPPGSFAWIPINDVVFAAIVKRLGRSDSVDDFTPDGHLDWYEAKFGPVRLAKVKTPPEFGYKTLVRDDSAKGLPTNLDREKEQNLPLPGSATPGGAGRDIGKFEFNTPDSDSDIQPRTLAVPGEEYGHPSNDTYNTVTRRTMTAAEIAVRRVMVRLAEEEFEDITKEAYTRRWKPGQRQRKQRGRSKIKSRQYYRKNRSKLRRKAKVWRRRNKNKGSFKQSERRRRRTTRKRRGSLMETPCSCCVASRYATELEPPRTRGGEDGKRQRRQLPEDKLDDRQYYRSNRSTRQRQSERWYKTVCKRKNRCLNRREKWQEDPEYYERGAPRRKRKASLLTVPEIAFGIGPAMMRGYVRSMSSMSGMVTFELDDDSYSMLESLPIEVFIRVAAFTSDEDIDAFFELVDAEIGLEAYEDLDEEGLRECAALYDKDPDSDEFKAKCFELTDDDDLSNLSGDQLDQVNDTLVLGILEGGGEPRDHDDARDGDETIGDEYDPHLYYGEVEMAKAQKEAGSPTGYEPWNDDGQWDMAHEAVEMVDEAPAFKESRKQLKGFQKGPEDWEQLLHLHAWVGSLWHLSERLDGVPTDLAKTALKITEDMRKSPHYAEMAEKWREPSLFRLSTAKTISMLKEALKTPHKGKVSLSKPEWGRTAPKKVARG